MTIFVSLCLQAMEKAEGAENTVSQLKEAAHEAGRAHDDLLEKYELLQDCATTAGQKLLEAGRDSASQRSDLRGVHTPDLPPWSCSVRSGVRIDICATS